VSRFVEMIATEGVENKIKTSIGKQPSAGGFA
jgi:hypothetical protein